MVDRGFIVIRISKELSDKARQILADSSGGVSLEDFARPLYTMSNTPFTLFKQEDGEKAGILAGKGHIVYYVKNGKVYREYPQ